MAICVGGIEDACKGGEIGRVQFVAAPTLKSVVAAKDLAEDSTVAAVVGAFKLDCLWGAVIFGLPKVFPPKGEARLRCSSPTKGRRKKSIVPLISRGQLLFVDFTQLSNSVKQFVGVGCRRLSIVV